MQIGLIGLGKMGIHLCQNMLRNDNQVVAFDLDKKLVDEAAPTPDCLGNGSSRQAN